MADAQPPTVRLALTTAPPDRAEALAEGLVSSGAAACVNIVPGLRSIYRWEGALANDPESLLLIKTSADASPQVAAYLDAHHPYEIHVLLVVALEEVDRAYAAWLHGALQS